MQHDDSVSDLGSPVDLAKSYMQSLPPWKSPFLGRQKFNTPPSKYFISSAEVLKEIYAGLGSLIGFGIGHLCTA
jgi:hypothetical protein